MEKKKAAEGEDKARPRFLFSFCWEEQGLFKKKKKKERKRPLTVAKETNYLFGYGNTL